MADTRKVTSPQPGKQRLYFESLADICVYGGSAGSGKTWSLTVDPLRGIKTKGFSAV